MPQITVQLLPTIRRELPWFLAMLAALLGSFLVADVVVRRGIILPSIAAGGDAPAWVWPALYAPELVAALMIGWRLRSWFLVGAYAGAAALLRESFHLALRLTVEPDSPAFASAVVELAIALPITLAAYAFVFSLAASGRKSEPDAA